MLRLVVNRIQRRRMAGHSRDVEPEMLRRSAMVLAPHQDDETLGCGGTVALKRRAGADVTVVYLMDGSRSHVPLIAAEELSHLRHREAVAAAGRLGVPEERVVFLDFPEGHLLRFLDEATDRLFDLLSEMAPDELFVPVDVEPNKDHAHTNIVARRAVERWGRPVVVYEYPVWCWYHWPSVPLPLTRRVLGPSRFRYEMPRIVANTRLMSFGAGIHREFPVRVPVGEVLTVKRAALEEHRSQMTRLRSTPKWATLSDVGGGAWLECFFTGEERFRSHVANSPGAADDGQRPGRRRVNPSGAVRRTLGSVRRELRSLRVVTIAEGPAAGLRIGLRHASADYGRVTNELPVQSAFAEVIRPGQTVYDIGSNVGFFALLAARLVDEAGEVYAFEAAPECSRALARNVGRNGFGNVTVHTMAVSDRSGEVELMQGRHPGGATISAADRPRDHRRSVVVPCDTIDNLVASGMGPPDFVKIDVEGAEAAVLEGMAKTLARHAPVVLCEVDDPTDHGIAAKVQRVRTILEKHGYRVEELDPSYEGSRSRVVHLLGRPTST